MNFRKACTLSCMIVALAVSAYAQEGGDPRVKKALDSLGLKYSVNSSNNFKVVYRMEDDADRSHLVFIVSKTSTYRSVEIREIWSIAAVLNEYPGEDVVKRLMTMNSTTKIGAWAIEASEDGEVWVMYTVKIPYDVSPKQLNDTVYFVAEVCDELEAELTGDDEY